MKKLNLVVSCVAVSSLMVLSGCQTLGGTAAKEDAAAAKAESDATLAASQAETAEVQAQLEVAQAEVDAKEAAAKSIPGSTVTQEGKLLFTAEGQSVAIAADGALGVAKARLAAETIAKAHLLEVLKGALITSSVTIGDLMFESHNVSTTVNGWLGGVTLETGTTANDQSRLPDAEPIDQIVTATATLEISEQAWVNLQDYVE